MQKPTLIDLFRGWPSSSLLPSSQLLEASQTVLSNSTIFIPALSYGPDPGYEPLREAIAKWLASFYTSSWTVASRICISGGASQCLACILQVYTDPLYTRNVYMVAPTYFLACRIFEDHGFGGRLKAVPEDDEGVDVEFLERQLKNFEEESNTNAISSFKPERPWRKFYKHIIYAVPTFSNPSGKSMTLLRRQQLVRLARQYDALIITDDVYDQLRWPSVSQAQILPRIVDIDHTLDAGPVTPFGNAVSNGSFSKIVGPGVRTGWAEGTERFVYGVSQCGSTTSGGAPSQLTAAIVAQLLRGGILDHHIEHVLVPTYQRRCGIMLEAIARYLVPLGVNVGDNPRGGKNLGGGGFFVWIGLPKPLKAGEFVAQAMQQGSVRVASGTSFEVSGDEMSVQSDTCIRLCFAWEEEGLLAEGIKRLGLVMAGLQKKSIMSAQNGHFN